MHEGIESLCSCTYVLSYYAGSYHHMMQACVSGLKAYKRGYVYWYKQMIVPPSEDKVGHFFKVQKTRMKLLHVCVHLHTVWVCGHVCRYICVCVWPCVYVCMYVLYVYVCAHCMHVHTCLWSYLIT